jgi:hypothetical protein
MKFFNQINFLAFVKRDHKKDNKKIIRRDHEEDNKK